MRLKKRKRKNPTSSQVALEEQSKCNVYKKEKYLSKPRKGHPQSRLIMYRSGVSASIYIANGGTRVSYGRLRTVGVHGLQSNQHVKWFAMRHGMHVL